MAPHDMPANLKRRALVRALQRQLRAGREAFMSPTLALDLGSENSRIGLATLPYALESMALTSMPSRITLDLSTGAVVAVGDRALQMLGRVPSDYRVEAPIQAGVITQPDLAELLIRRLIGDSIGNRRVMRPDLVIATPANATSVQLRALAVAAHAAGARRVHLIDESMAAALGADLPVMCPQGSLIVEIGAEKTAIAVISLGGIVASSTIRVGGAQISDAIANHLRKVHHLLIGRSTADAIKIAIGSAIEPLEPTRFSTRGRDVLRRIPATVELKANDLVEPIQDVLGRVVTEIRVVLERTPPELCADLSTAGIVLSGGASQLTGLSAFLERKLQLPARVVEEPAASVVRGCQRGARDRSFFRDLLRDA